MITISMIFSLAVLIAIITNGLWAFKRSNTIISTLSLHMSMKGKTSFLGSADEQIYFNTCLRRSIEGCKACLKDGKTLIEVEFLPNRKSDLSVSETLDTNRKFSREFVKSFRDLGKDLWLVFPDQKESSLARRAPGWGDDYPFTLTSIQSAMTYDPEVKAKLIVAINPGFNVEEWIDLPKIQRGSPMIIINGNLDRLRNGYYPRIFYPGLHKVTQDFYRQAIQALFLSPVAVGGSRLGAWLAKEYPGDWEILVKRAEKNSDEYDVVSSTSEPLAATATWQLAKDAYLSRRGGSLF